MTEPLHVAMIRAHARHQQACREEFLKLDFMLKRMESMERKIFSLANCDVTTAREFINYFKNHEYNI